MVLLGARRAGGTSGEARRWDLQWGMIGSRSRGRAMKIWRDGLRPCCWADGGISTALSRAALEGPVTSSLLCGQRSSSHRDRPARCR
jgi:hypothetical protein